MFARALLAVSLGAAAVVGLAPAAEAQPICVTANVVPITVTTALGSVTVGGNKTVCV